MKKTLFFAAVLLAVGAALFAQSDLQPLANIKIGNKTETITLKQLKTRVDIYQKQARGQIFTVDQKKEILDAMIDEKLVCGAAQKMGMAVTDSQANEYFLQAVAQQVGQQVTEQEFAKIVKEQSGMTLDDFFKAQVGMNVSDYKAYLKNQLLSEQYILANRQKEIQAIAATDAEIRAYYELNKSSFVQSDMLKLFLVIIPKVGDGKDAKKTADSLMAELKSGKTTPAKIKARLQDPKANLNYKAGDILINKSAQASQQLGIDYSSLLELFGKTKGFYSEINESEVDCQFFTILEKYDAKMLTISDIVQPDTTVTVYDYIRGQLTQQKQYQYLQTAVKEVTETLRTPENFQMIKTGDALIKLLNW